MTAGPRLVFVILATRAGDITKAYDSEGAKGIPRDGKARRDRAYSETSSVVSDRSSLIHSPTKQASSADIFKERGALEVLSDPHSTIVSLTAREVGPVSEPLMRQTVSGLSLGSKNSVGSLRARDQPRLKRANSYSSAASSKTADLAASISKSTVVSDLDIGSLRGHNIVEMTTEHKIDEMYISTKKLGQGGFGQVWLMIHKKTFQEFAVKRLALDGIEPEYMERMEAEMQVLARLQHKYIVRLHEVFRDPESMHLVMDLCLGGDLMDYLLGWWSDKRHPERMDAQRQHRCKGLPWQDVVPLLWQMLASIAYLHHHRFCHRDIKLENFMLQAADLKVPELRLVDFGMSVLMRPGQILSQAVGTLTYMAPEVLAKQYNEKCDIWSLGICAYILCLKATPYGDEQSRDADVLASAIFSNMRGGWPDCDKPTELRSLVDKLMTYDPALRPGAKQILKESTWLKRHGKPNRVAVGCCSVQ